MFGLIKFIAAALAIVKEVEELIPESGKGAEKLSIAKALLEVLYDDFQELSEPFEKVWLTINRVIDKVVAIWNGTGTFKK